MAATESQPNNTLPASILRERIEPDRLATLDKDFPNWDQPKTPEIPAEPTPATVVQSKLSFFRRPIAWYQENKQGMLAFGAALGIIGVGLAGCVLAFNLNSCNGPKPVPPPPGPSPVEPTATPEQVYRTIAPLPSETPTELPKPTATALPTESVYSQHSEKVPLAAKSYPIDIFDQRDHMLFPKLKHNVPEDIYLYMGAAGIWSAASQTTAAESFNLQPGTVINAPDEQIMSVLDNCYTGNGIPGISKEVSQKFCKDADAMSGAPFDDPSYDMIQPAAEDAYNILMQLLSGPLTLRP